MCIILRRELIDWRDEAMEDGHRTKAGLIQRAIDRITIRHFQLDPNFERSIVPPREHLSGSASGKVQDKRRTGHA